MKFIISGGKKLKGEITLSGAKNATSKMLVASLLTDGKVVLTNTPVISEVDITLELCAVIGSEFKKDDHSISIQTKTVKNFCVTSLSRRNRIPILALGPLLARAGIAEIPFLGGDKIGARPVGLHLNALRAMGAEIEVSNEIYKVRASHGLHGAEIVFDFPSVGATENVLLSAVLATGRTTIKNAAKEPEIIALIKMLQKMGAIIDIGAHRTIHIDGVKKLHGVEHEVLADRNEAVSFACLAVATSGDIFVKGANQEYLITFLSALRRAGAEYEVRNSGIRFWRPGRLIATNIETDTHPGFMTDWQQPFAVMLTQAHGVSKIHETIYEDRFGYAVDLNNMGANIKVSSECFGDLLCRFKNSKFNHSAEIIGPTPLRAAKLKVRDLRSGMAHTIAALVASGESTIEGIEEIDRGYECLEERPQALGADIKRIN